MRDFRNIVSRALDNMDKYGAIEEAVEGKTISSISGDGYGVIIHFTDGTTYRSAGGEVSYDGEI